MRRMITALILVALLVGAASALARPAGTRQSPTGNIQASYMFVFNGPTSTMTPVAGSPGVYTFSMPLTSSAQPVIWFTVRPSRMTGTFPMSQFVALWTLNTAFGFSADPPNVAISTTSRGVPNVFVAEMSNAVVQASGVSNTLVLQATMTALQGQSLSAVQGSKTSFLGQSAKTTSASPVTSAKQTTVFVERSVCASGNCVPVPIS
ncbi:MAG: hypothetical protein ACR2J9_02655 [Gaiellales bacterium]